MRTGRNQKGKVKGKSGEKRAKAGKRPNPKPSLASKPSKPQVVKHDDGSTRLNKYISNAGICSRREADVLIKTGVISINGKIITELGMRVMPGDTVQYDGETISKEKPRYVLLNKPKNFTTNTDDPEKKQSVMFLIRNACREQIFPVGRLDRMTSGLMLFTNDVELAKKLVHPTHGVRKMYHVTTAEKINPLHLEQIRAGIELDDGMIAAEKIEFVEKGKKGFEIGIEIRSGKNRIVRRIFEHFGYTITKMDRVIFAELTKKDLPRGHYRFLSEDEVKFLRMV